MANTLGFISVKGGVGKTTMALETASSLVNDFGKKVLLVDANFSSPSLSLQLGIEPDLTLHDALAGMAGRGLHNVIYERYGMHVIPADLLPKQDANPFKLQKVLSKVNNRYDFVILDSSPHYYELVPVITAADSLFVVTTPDIPTLSLSMKAAFIAKNKGTPINGMVVNKIRNPAYELSLKDIEEAADIPVVARVRDHGAMVKAAHNKMPITLFSPSNRISREVKNFAASLVGLPEKLGFFDKLFSFGAIGKEKVNRELMRKKFY